MYFEALDWSDAFLGIYLTTAHLSTKEKKREGHFVNRNSRSNNSCNVSPRMSPNYVLRTNAACFLLSLLLVFWITKKHTTPLLREWAREIVNELTLNIEKTYFPKGQLFCLWLCCSILSGWLCQKKSFCLGGAFCDLFIEFKHLANLVLFS